tara:strand:+ start:916 stop:1575 length:660 start_codon:yes stop_codon:yes gene_type:complete
MIVTGVKFQKIEIKEVYIPKIRTWEIQPPILDLITKPVVDIPACVNAHRNNLTGLINKDELGTYKACGTFDIPSFEPLDYNPANFQYTAPAKQQENPQEQPPQQQAKIPEKKKKEEIKIDPCPPKNPQFRQGDYRNDKKIERLVKWERSPSDGITCVGIWEKVPFRESFIGTPQVLISTTVLGVVAGGSALLAPVIKKLISEIFKKIKKQLTKKKDEVK